jgi:hypothetical protein
MTNPIRLAWLAAALGMAALSSSGASDIEAYPFAKKSGTGERMTFTKIPASESGLNVENPYDDPAMWGERYIEFSTGEIGSGIAVGDLMCDGSLCIFVANKTRPSQLFKQVAPFKFVDVTAEAGVAGPPAANGVGWKTGVTIADFNNDGYPDIYVCRYNAPNLLYLNDGHGHFKEVGHKAGVDLVSGSVVGAFEDYDRDGYLDLFVLTNILDANNAPDGEQSHLFHNNRDGTFTDVTEKSGISRVPGHGHSATWFDYNGDGWPDLYVANDYGEPDHLYRNNGDGTFTDVLATAVPHTTWFSMGSDSADINNDGMPDLFVADMAGTTHFKSKVTMGDMGGLVNFMDTLETPKYMKNALFLNSGADRFMEVSKMAGVGSSDWSWSTRFEDLDNDGWVDMHVTNGMVRPFNDSDLQGQIRKLSSRAEVIALMKRQPPQAETHLVFHNDHNLHFTKVQKEWGLDEVGVSFGSAFADFDNDGDLDLVYVNYDGNLSLFRNDCPVGNSIILELRGRESNSFGIGAQAIAHTEQGIQTRRLSVARGSLSTSQPILHFGLGSSTSVAELEIRWPSGHVQRFRNLKANYRYVITEPAGRATPPPAVASRPVDHGLFHDVAGARGIDFVTLERPFDDMKRQSLLPNRMNTLGEGIAFGDVLGNGVDDIFFAGAAGHGSALYLGDGLGKFHRSHRQQPWDDTIEREAMSAVFVDVRHTGAEDLLVVSGGVEAGKGSDLLRSHLYLNDGHGRFSEAPQDEFNPPPESCSVICAADYRRTGWMGVFIGGRVVPGEYPTTPQSFLYENRNGTLVDVTDTACPALRHLGMVTSALWTDADGDGWPDLLVAGEWMPLRLFHNNHDGTFTEATKEAGLSDFVGWWNSLTAADLRGDGTIDYIAGNVGLNTKYKATAEHPVGIYYVDFEGNGKPQIIESEYEGDRLFPVRGRSCSSKAMPSLKDKFPTFHAFGSAQLPDIYTPEKLAGSLHLTANTLASGVFMNDGHGHFTFHELPRLAQVSPIFGLAACDFDGDGHVDLVAVQNFFGPQVETGRFDGGLGILLLGDGKGGFRPASAQESGIYITGEGRGLAVADLNHDGWPGLVVTRVNENALALEDRAAKSGGHSFSVKLSGDPGNTDAIGSRITVHYLDGSLSASELYAGSGYLSQSEPVAFFGFRPANPPVSIDVAWPDGTRSTHPFKAGVPRIVLKKGV